MNIGIIGAGGVGGYFGAKLGMSNEGTGANVYFIARGDHLKAIRENGLKVQTSSEGIIIARPTLATDDIGALPKLDICLLCVKSYDLDNVIESLAGKVSDTTEILPLLNGIDIYERIRSRLHIARIFPACVFIGTHILSPGVIEQNGGARKIQCGKDPGNPSSLPSLTMDLFDRSSITYEWIPDINVAIWSKFIFIASFGLVTACFGKTLGQVMESSDLSAYVHSIMNEILAIAGQEGIALPSTIISDSYRKGNDFSYDTKTSFQRDFESIDKKDERDLFADTIIRLGKKSNVRTPATEKLSKLLNQKKPMNNPRL